MRIGEYLEEMKSLQIDLLRFIECEDDIENNFQVLINSLKEKKICDDKHKLSAYLHLLSRISNSHHRKNDFFSKIEKIITTMKDKIANNFTNLEIFNIFKSNKRVLLFLHDEKIINIDENISKRFISYKYLTMHYPHYFLPEIKPYIKKEWFGKFEAAYIRYDYVKSLFDSIDKDLPEKFYENRKKGENEGEICEFIRNDSIKEFIVYINKNNISLNSKIQSSIYETNSFLLKKKTIKLIEYAAFFGSIQIFYYLRMNNIKLTKSLWLYCIHGENGEMIHLLEENHINPPKNDDHCDICDEVYIEAIKSHHNEIANYIMNCYLTNEDEKSKGFIIQYLKYFNFVYIKKEMINESLFYDLCQYDHSLFVNDFLKEKNIDLNKEIKRTGHEVVECEWIKNSYITEDEVETVLKCISK